MHTNPVTYFHHALHIVEEACTGCSRCMQACPTQAIRVSKGKARINGNKCVDCGECYRVCPVSAIEVEQDDLRNIYSFNHRIALVPSVFFGLFPGKISHEQVVAGILELGFTRVIEIERTVPVIMEAQRRLMHSAAFENRPVSAFCPAIVRLIQVKFPALTGLIMPVKPPVDLAAHWCIKMLADQGILREQAGFFYITPCAAKIAAIKSPVGDAFSPVDGVINMNSFYDKVFGILRTFHTAENKTKPAPLTEEEMLWALPGGESKHAPGRTLSIDGIHQVTEFLEKMEDDEITRFSLLELRACQNGCAGGILVSGNRYLIAESLQNSPKAACSDPDFLPEEMYQYLLGNSVLGAIEPRPGLILDKDPAVAMKKLARIRKLMCYLPGFDCSACGAPTCLALAEDIVSGTAHLSHCPFMQRIMEKRHKLHPDHSYQIMEKIWGKDRIEKNCNKKGAENESL